jgi:23S rRNA (guanosine2251-2'-O)-methyltransferase
MKEWISGRNPVYETLRAGRRHFFRLWLSAGTEGKGRIKDILQLAAQHKLQVQRVPRQQLDALSEKNQGVALEVSGYPYSDLNAILQHAEELQEPAFILLLDTLQDPQNFGTLLRTAEAFGVHGVVIPSRRAVGITPAVVNVSSGASEHLLVAVNNLAQAIRDLKNAGIWVMGLEAGPQAQPIDKVRLDGPLALVIGSEGSGLRLLVRNSCDVLLHLPMKGEVESLNAAVAGGIALYLASRSRRK